MFTYEYFKEKMLKNKYSNNLTEQEIKKRYEIYKRRYLITHKDGTKK